VFRLGFAGAAVGVVLVASISVGFTAAKHGPAMLIQNSDPVHRIWILQLYLAAALIIVLPFAALLEERRKLERALRSRKARYRLLFEQVGEAIFLYPMTTAVTPGNFEKVNNMACSQYGYSREELLCLSPVDLQAPENPEG